MQLSEIPPSKKIAREYELVYILTPRVDPDEADRIANRLQEVVGRLQGKITKVDQWGRRRLAYPINKTTRGVFVCVRMVGYSDLVAEVERNLRNADAVVRFQTVRLDTVVELEAVKVDPEQVKFARIERPAEEEAEPTVEERLGLNVKPREHRDDYGLDDDDIPNLDEVISSPPSTSDDESSEN